MSTHNICFSREINKILCGYPLLSVAMAVSAMLLVSECYVPPPKEKGTCFWYGSRWCWHDTFLSAQYFVNQWLDAHQIFMDIYSWDITKNQLDFDDLDLIFKVTAVEKLKIL